MNYTHKMGVVIWALVLVFILTPIFAVEYQNSQEVFDASVFYVNDQKLPYSIIVNLDGKS